jgi:phage terminase large subunit
MFPAYKPYYKAGERTIWLPTGGKVFFKSLEDPKYVEGITAHSAWIDEADLITYPAYLVVRGRVNATMGRMLLTSSIADNSWLAEYVTKLSDDRYDIISWESKENPAFSKEEWEALKEELDPSIFRRRYEAKLDFAKGLVYSNFDLKSKVVSDIPPSEVVEKAFIGADWGFNDPTAIVVILVTNVRRAYVWKEFYVEGLQIDPVVAAFNKFIKDIKEKFNLGVTIFADPSNKQFLQSVSGMLRHDIIPGERDIFNGTAAIRNLIYQGRFFIFRNCENTLKEIRTYRFKEKHWERLEEPEDRNNHLLDAIRYVLASYSLGATKYGDKKEGEVLPDFWIRRTVQYRNARNESAFDLHSQSNYDNDICIP